MRPMLPCALWVATFVLSSVSATTIPRQETSLVDHDSLAAGHLSSRDGHGHHGHGHAQPLLELNETELLMTHSPTPESYYTIDWEDPENSASRHPGFMITHAIAMSSAFFVALPAGIALRSVKHSGHVFAVGAFWALVTLGSSAGGLYKKMTPDMYEGSKHGSHGYIVLLIAAVLTILDGLSIIRRIITFFREGHTFELRTFWQKAIMGREEHSGSTEYISLMTSEPEETEGLDKNNDRETVSGGKHRPSPIHVPRDSTEAWVNDHHRRPSSSRSHSSDDTLHEGLLQSRAKSPKGQWLSRIGTILFGTTERILVFLGLVEFVSGIVVYTGGCRGNYLNGCLAHLIKGGIFWSYGLVTFARFLGSFSELGWAWNRVPVGDYVSAEFTESAVIFTYGITNTWMERFGAHAGDPFTTKQLQHIGIAVMFWFAGLVGMGIESKRVRRWLSSSSVASVQMSNIPQDSVAEPPSYAASFNPFPALVIGVTGAAMAAHFQAYVFQVQIHSLWGNLLVAFAVLRCMTYFFLWLSPPRSILPSRPPTEALGSFFLACGGLEFMFSTEEVTIAAMRRGRDDVMMFMCVGIAITCFAFCWTMGVVAFKGWLRSHYTRKVSFFTAA